MEYSSENTKQKALVQYILKRLDRHQRGSTPIDYNLMTIEHVAPENPKPGVVGAKNYANIGNLLLMDEKRNGDLGNKDFLVKKAVYKASGVPLDKTLAAAQVWGDSGIASRASDLAAMAYKKVFRV